MSERDDAIRLAKRVLDKPFIDPDGDICMLARQFLRAIEWQAIETAPKNVNILLYSPPHKLSHDPDQAHDIRVSTTRDWCWATHWQPLPAPPSGDAP